MLIFFFLNASKLNSTAKHHHIECQSAACCRHWSKLKITEVQLLISVALTAWGSSLSTLLQILSKHYKKVSAQVVLIKQLCCATKWRDRPHQRCVKIQSQSSLSLAKRSPKTTVALFLDTFCNFLLVVNPFSSQ